jgi:hypothetical protein
MPSRPSQEAGSAPVRPGQHDGVFCKELEHPVEIVGVPALDHQPGDLEVLLELRH